MGVVQEVKAGNAIEALRKLSTPKALVKRNEVVKEIESEHIVPGDPSDTRYQEIYCCRPSLD